MFTGLVAELGRITGIENSKNSAVFTIDAPVLIRQISVGDSIAVNGVCLTATSISGTTFTADVMVQTLRMTSLSKTSVGSPVNLELAARLNERIGGHLVQGHVDGVATVARIAPADKWTQLDIVIAPQLAKYIVNQGSICIDGVSLTVGSIEDATNTVTVWLIPETLAKTNLGSKKQGDWVNIEVDVLAKYVERLMNKGETRE